MELNNKTGAIFPKDITKTYEVDEEDYKINIGYDILSGMPRLFGTFTKQVDQENFLKISGDATVTLPEDGDVATHYNQYNPEPKVGLPNEDRDSGEYTPRHVGASSLVPMAEVPLPLVKNNKEIKAGDRLEIRDPKKGLDKSQATIDTCVAVQDVSANTGGYVLVKIEGSIRVKIPEEEPEEPETPEDP